MRLKFLLAGMLSVAISSTSFAQQYRIKHAQDAYDDYLKLSMNKATYQKADESLQEARESIDIAANNKKTSSLPQTLGLKAAIYATYALRDTSKKNNISYFNSADSAYRKGKEADTKGEFKTLFDEAAKILGQGKLNQGIFEYGKNNFDMAYKDFSYFKELFPTDTIALYYAGLAAQKNNDVPNAMANYEKLMPLQFSQNPFVFYQMSSYYLAQKDTAKSLKVASEGVIRYPDDANLRSREIELSIVTGKSANVLNKVQAAIAADPKNKSLYFYAGLTYSSAADAAHRDWQKAVAAKKDAATIAALEAKKNEYYSKAADMYKKALDIDPNYFEATLNLSTALLAPAIDIHNYAVNLPANKQKEYTALQAKAAAQFEVAKPYVLKAVELQPTNKDALGNLKSYYVGIDDMTKATETTKKINAGSNNK